ncbi:hypothetical protein G6F23_013215 [Rhizopus arrhizus]|nr:hypothetical protein G6F23_013215 [Rhizopus arrhizus]
MSSQKDYITLNRTGQKMPIVGFGTARIDAKDTEEVIYNAIKTGYRLVDAALLYGNEAEVGKGIKRALSDGIVKREELFVISKLWNSHHNKDSVRKAIKVTLEDLGLDYIDLYLIHSFIGRLQKNYSKRKLSYNKKGMKLSSYIPTSLKNLMKHLQPMITIASTFYF